MLFPEFPMISISRAVLLAGTTFLMPAAFAQTLPQTPPSQDALTVDAASDSEPGDEIIVQATRSGRRVQDEPVRVEVINREEIEEKILMRPGNIATILSETGGLRVQVTSPSLGGANVRVQGMDGRFTQLLADGLPLYGGQSSSLGLLQVPPTDLGQVEVIKGAASALYGPSALGGVINLVSRRPSRSFEGEVLANVTSRNGQDLTAYAAAPLGGDWSGSVTGGHHRQSRQDLDGDGWTDTPGYSRWTVRPRLFFENASGATLFATLGAMTEKRRGGTAPGALAPDGTPFPIAQDTDRFDGGLIAALPIEGVGTAHFRASGMTQGHVHTFGDVVERDRHGTLFAEGSLSGKSAGTAWVAGLAYQVDTFRSVTFPAMNYTYRVPGVFAQVEQELGKITVAASARADFHSEYGSQFSPRLSVLYRTGPWTLRASGGRGFYAPTPFVEEIEAAGLSRLEPLSGLRAETAETASLDLGYRRGPLEVNVSLFASNINGATRLEDIAPDRVRLVNGPGQTRNYVFVDASEPNLAGAGRRQKPLTPAHTAGIVAMWEEHDKGRMGFEVYYTGAQALDDNPYRGRGKAYFEIGFMAEIAVGKAKLFVNAENILGVRQTSFDPLVRPSRTADGRWTVDAWGPTEGFVLNGGVRFKFGGPG
jgi:outer membrane receptor for ferrienterochelin and colicins